MSPAAPTRVPTGKRIAYAVPAFALAVVGIPVYVYIPKFYTDVVGKSEAQLKRHWSQLVFTGKGKPPPSVADDQAVKDWVASTPGAIGYIDGGSVDASVKVLSIIP